VDNVFLASLYDDDKSCKYDGRN